MVQEAMKAWLQEEAKQKEELLHPPGRKKTEQK